MTRSIPWIRRVVLFAALGPLVAAQQSQQPPPPPNQAFRAVHTFLVHPDEEQQFLAAIQQINAAIVKAGCTSCIYHEFKVNGPQTGPYNYLQVSEWPGGDVYTRVHNSADYLAVTKRLSNVTSLVYRAQTYNRYVEVKP
jgi:hypothetical protein